MTNYQIAAQSRKEATRWTIVGIVVFVIMGALVTNGYNVSGIITAVVLVIIQRQWQNATEDWKYYRTLPPSRETGRM